MKNGNLNIHPEVVLCTQGTRGDVAPFLGLAARLVASGRRVTILANDNWEKLAATAGAEFLSLGPPDPPQTRRNDRKFFEEAIFPTFAKTYMALQSLVAEGRMPTVLFRSSMAGAAAASEALRLVSGCIYLQPSAVMSYRRPSWPLTPLVSGPLGCVGRSVVLPAMIGLGRLLNPFAGPTNRFRMSKGLAPLLPLAPPPATFSLMACPDWFAMPQVDWPKRCYVTGFLYPPKDATLPTRVSNFVERYGKPLVFTPGTGITDVRDFVARSRATARALNLPGIILTPHEQENEHHDGGAHPILSSGFVDLATLLPISRALVHHGGIGTVAQAIRAGVPQLVVPDRFDQPDNAVRVAQLGLGGALLRAGTSTKQWIAVLREVLESSHVRQQIATAAGLVAQSDGTVRALAVMVQHETRG